MIQRIKRLLPKSVCLTIGADARRKLRDRAYYQKRKIPRELKINATVGIVTVLPVGHILL